MAFCKARVQCMIWSFARNRGFCQKAEAVHEPTNLFAIAGEQAVGDQKGLLPVWVVQQMMASVKAEKEALAASIGYLKAEKEALAANIRYLETYIGDLTEEIGLWKELRTSAELSVLRVQGLNNARGLFEKLQKHLAVSSPKGLRGSALWEAILKQHPSLGVCIEGHVKVKSSDSQKQAMHIYHIYTNLSNHVHAGKELAALQSNAGGTILFQRGPMSPEEVCIFKCIGDAVGFKLAEDPDTIPR